MEFNLAYRVYNDNLDMKVTVIFKFFLYEYISYRKYYKKYNKNKTFTI